MGCEECKWCFKKKVTEWPCSLCSRVHGDHGLNRDMYEYEPWLDEAEVKTICQKCE